MRVPQWMFDAAAPSDFRPVDRPAVEYAALVDLTLLQSSISQRRDERLLQVEHPTQGDVELIKSTACGAIEHVPSDPEVAQLVSPASDGATAHTCVAGATVSGSDAGRSRVGFTRAMHPAVRRSDRRAWRAMRFSTFADARRGRYAPYRRRLWSTISAPTFRRSRGRCLNAGARVPHRYLLADGGRRRLGPIGRRPRFRCPDTHG
jgi:hypothetical protein